MPTDTWQLINETCAQCRRVFGMLVQPEDMARWRNGELIQRAMPYLMADQRELLISKTCGECFDRLFEDDDED